MDHLPKHVILPRLEGSRRGGCPTGEGEVARFHYVPGVAWGGGADEADGGIDD